MRFRGPDALHTWIGEGVGFGHAMLRTACESWDEGQPLSLDDRVWIIADARVDGRSDLCRKLKARGHDARPGANDAELILLAYRAWGEECTRHLLGDFAFAIWDTPRQRLFCARDHLGVKPLFYAHADNCLIFGNTLSVVRAHPALTDELNDQAIADFLLFGINQDQASTAFDRIRRLPPAHRMICSADTLRIERYWDLPSEGGLRYPNTDDYVDHFVEIFDAAVEDRLRSGRIGVLMSGGLDSTAVAASAKKLLLRHGADFDLRAYTCVFDSLFADEERHFADLAAQSLGVPVHYLAADDYPLFGLWRGRVQPLPEPVDEPLAAVYIDQAKQMAENCRVALTGWDGDALLSEGPNGQGGPCHRATATVRRAARLAGGALSARQWPRLNLRARLARALFGPPEEAFGGPVWLNAELVRRLDLPARWRILQSTRRSRGQAHKEAYRVLTSPMLTSLLERYDPGVTGIPVEARHPLLDVRVVAYVLSLPVVPWCIDKKLLRVAMRHRLPDAVRLRPKSPLAGDPVVELLQRADAHWLDEFDASPALGRYIDRPAVAPLAGTLDSDRIWTDLRPLCLNLWLQHLSGSHHASRQEPYNDVA